jgi:hypothetical protein
MDDALDLGRDARNGTNSFQPTRHKRMIARYRDSQAAPKASSAVAGAASSARV